MRAMHRINIMLKPQPTLPRAAVLKAAALLACAALAGAPQLASAQATAPKFSAQYTTCLDKASGVTAAMHACMSAEMKLQDQKLNSAYKALVAELNPARKKQLQTAQRLWIQYRDTNCGFYDDPDGGSMAGVLAGDCLLQMTAQRAQELADLNAMQ